MSITLFKRQLARCGQAITVQKRTLEPSDFESSQPVETFSDIDSPDSLILTIGDRNINGGGRLFSGIQIVDGATHMFCMEYADILEPVEEANYFILLKARRFRILAVTNINEQDKVLAIQATERGSNALEATKA